MNPLFVPPDAPTVCVGSRPPAHRRLFKLGLVTLATAIAMVHVAPPVSRALNTHLGNAVAQLETEQAQARLGTGLRDEVPAFDHVLAIEDAWRHGDFKTAAVGWMEQTQTVAHAQDLSLAGWSVRAALRSDDRALVDQAVATWNTVALRVPVDIQAQPLVWDAATTPHDLYLQMTAMGMPSEATPSEAQWLSRTPSPVEYAADMGMCGTALGCEAPSVMPLREVHEATLARIKGWQNRGFTAQQAWDLYREQQMLGDSDHEVSSRHHQTLVPAEQLRLVMRQHLARVATPSDLSKYWHAWPMEAARLNVNLASDQQMGIVGGLGSHEVDWTLRAKGESSGWPIQQAQPATLWQRLQSVMIYQVGHAPIGDVPDHLTMAQADKRLLQATQQAGLSQLRWPSVFPNSPQVKWRLANLVESANSRLEHATGWQGPVLGHAGHTVLDLAACPGAEELGFQTPLGGPHPAVLIASVIDRDSLGALAHEWAHADDYFVGRDATAPAPPGWASEQVARQMATPLQAWLKIARPASAPLQLWEALTAPDMTPGQRQSSALEGWTERQVAMHPERRAHWLSVAAQWHSGEPLPAAVRESDSVQLAELAQIYSSAQAAPSFRSGQVDMSSSAWVRASRQDSVRSYWGSTPELVARSFEAQMAGDRELSTRDQVGWVYYPQGVEKHWQAQAWKAYFQEQAGWWSRWRQSSAPKLADHAPPSPVTSRPLSSAWSPSPR